MPAPWPSSGFSSKASIATRQKSCRPAPERSAKCCRGLVGELQVGAGELVPGAAADRDRDADRDDRHGDRQPFQQRRVAGELDRAPGQRPLAARSSRRRPAKSASARAVPGEQDQQHRRRPGRRPPGWRGCRRGCGAPAPRAPPAAPRSPPIASVASSQSRSWERAIRQPAATSQGQQAAARVGEVEGQQHRRHRRDRRASAARVQPSGGSSRAAARRDPEHRPVGVPVAERVAQPRPAAERVRRRSSTWGRRRLARPRRAIERDGNCEPFSETLAPLVGLGDEECGKEEAEVDQDAVRLDHAQLHRTRPEG